MKKQSASKRGERRNSAAKEGTKYLSLSRQTYKRYLEGDHDDEDDEASPSYDPDQIVRLAY